MVSKTWMSFWNFKRRYYLGGKNKIQFGVIEKNYAVPIVFSNLWAGWTLKYILSAKFGDLVQKWGKVSLPKKGAGKNPKPHSGGIWKTR
jgi:hypothetical protein